MAVRACCDKDRRASQIHTRVEEQTSRREAKEQLFFSAGIPVDQQRLVFSAAQSEAAESVDLARKGFAFGASSWQAIVFAEGKAIGRLVRPRTDISPLGRGSFVEGKQGEDSTVNPLHSLTLTFDYWQPSQANKKLGKECQICIPVSNSFKDSTYKLQLIGSHEGSTFAVPVPFSFSGKDTAASISQHLQRIQYIKEQHSRFKEQQQASCSAVAGIHPFVWSQQQLTVECGSPTSQCLLTFQIHDPSPWLQRVELRLAVFQQAGSKEESLASSSAAGAAAQEHPAKSAVPAPVGAGCSSSRATKRKQLASCMEGIQVDSGSVRTQRDSMAESANSSSAGEAKPVPQRSAVVEDQLADISINAGPASAGTTSRNGGTSSGKRGGGAVKSGGRGDPDDGGDDDAGSSDQESSDSRRQGNSNSNNSGDGDKDKDGDRGHRKRAADKDSKKEKARKQQAEDDSDTKDAATVSASASAGSNHSSQSTTPKGGARPVTGFEMQPAAEPTLNNSCNAHIEPGIGNEQKPVEYAPRQNGKHSGSHHANGKAKVKNGLIVPGNATAGHQVEIPVAQALAAAPTGPQQHSCCAAMDIDPSNSGMETSSPAPPARAAAPSPAAGFAHAASEPSLQHHNSSTSEAPAPPPSGAALLHSAASSHSNSSVSLAGDVAAMAATQQQHVGPAQHGHAAQHPSQQAASWRSAPAPPLPPQQPPQRAWSQGPQPPAPSMGSQQAYSASGSFGFNKKHRNSSYGSINAVGQQSYGTGGGGGHKQYGQGQGQGQQRGGQQYGRGSRGNANGSDGDGDYYPTSHSRPQSRGPRDGGPAYEGQGPHVSEPSASTDLERFIMQVTPMLSLDASKAPEELLLGDVWRFYLEPSCYGREVYSLGGARGPSMCYFVPYLSAIQLFVPASPKEPGTNRLYVSDTEGWPRHMHLKFEHFETALPFNRAPLYEVIEGFAGACSCGGAAAAATATGNSGSKGAGNAGSAAAAPAAAAATAPAAAVVAPAGGGDVEAAGVNAGAAAASLCVGTPTSTLDVAGHSSDSSSSGGSSSSQSPASGAGSAASAADSSSAESSATQQQQQEGSTEGSGSSSTQAAATAAPAGPSSTGSSAGAAAAPASLQASPPQPHPQQPQCSGACVLKDLRVCDLHPASWFAVAWYPVYRIPDAPLCARFLTFHSFAPLVATLQHAQQAYEQHGIKPGPVIPLQVVGLKWYNMHGERWLESLTEPGPNSRGGYEEGGRRRGHYSQSSQLDFAWQAHLGELQGTAERLARGHGLRVLGQMGAEEVRLQHSDFEFFNNRG